MNEKKQSTLETVGTALENFSSHPRIQQRGDMSVALQSVLYIPQVQQYISKITYVIASLLEQDIARKANPEMTEKIQKIATYKRTILGIAWEEKRLLGALICNSLGPKMMVDCAKGKEVFSKQPIPYGSSYRKQYMTCGSLSTLNRVALGNLAQEAWEKGIDQYDTGDYAIVLGFACSRLIVHITYFVIMGHFLGNYTIQDQKILELAEQIGKKFQEKELKKTTLQVL